METLMKVESWKVEESLMQLGSLLRSSYPCSYDAYSREGERAAVGMHMRDAGFRIIYPSHLRQASSR